MTAPLSLHPDNPHYFLFRGQPTVLVTSAEHYGAVLNADFDYRRYLQTLAADGMNHTRIFVGAYCEPEGAFRIARNTLAPAAGRFLSPWARSQEHGYANGGSKFDLARWDEDYFERLRDFVGQAGEAGVVVEVNLFCPFYQDDMWDLSPMKASNNVNGIGAVPKEEAYTVDGSGELMALQEEMTRKVVSELRAFDNLFYEVMNEPYQRDVPMAWQHRIVDVIVATEATAAADGNGRHLISLNVANRQAEVRDPHPAVSIFNFHYAWPPDTVPLNYGLGLPIGDNETGFTGQDDYPYRREAWAFLLTGGVLFNHLDYSFAVGFEDGSFDYPETQPGGGSPALRQQLRILREFIDDFEFVRMTPLAPGRVGGLPQGLAAYGLEEPGRQYAVYVCKAGEDAAVGPGDVEMSLQLPAGRYRVEWVDTGTGELMASEEVVNGGDLRLRSPVFTEDVALRLVVAPGGN